MTSLLPPVQACLYTWQGRERVTLLQVDSGIEFVLVRSPTPSARLLDHVPRFQLHRVSPLPSAEREDRRVPVEGAFPYRERLSNLRVEFDRRYLDEDGALPEPRAKAPFYLGFYSQILR